MPFRSKKRFEMKATSIPASRCLDLEIRPCLDFGPSTPATPTTPYPSEQAIPWHNSRCHPKWPWLGSMIVGQPGAPCSSLEPGLNQSSNGLAFAGIPHRQLSCLGPDQRRQESIQVPGEKPVSEENINKTLFPATYPGFTNKRLQVQLQRLSSSLKIAEAAA